MSEIENERDLEQDLQLDRSNLTDELEKQASMCYYWNSEAADAVRSRDQAISRRDVKAADLEMDIRKQWSSGKTEEGVKVTEGIIKAYLASHADTQAATKEVIEAEHRLKMLNGAVRAIDHKKSEIDNATRLWLAGYWQDPGRKAAGKQVNQAQYDELNEEPI